MVQWVKELRKQEKGEMERKLSFVLRLGEKTQPSPSSPLPPPLPYYQLQATGSIGSTVTPYKPNIPRLMFPFWARGKVLTSCKYSLC